MKLYATTTSERASKGQGGNKHIEMTLFVGSSNDSREVVKIKAKTFIDKNGVESYAVLGSWHGATESEKVLHTGTLKGERQKGECENKDANGNACYDCESGQGMPCGYTPEA